MSWIIISKANIACFFLLMFHQEIQKDRRVKADLTEVQTAAGLADDVLLSPRLTRSGRSLGPGDHRSVLGSAALRLPSRKRRPLKAVLRPSTNVGLCGFPAREFSRSESVVLQNGFATEER